MTEEYTPACTRVGILPPLAAANFLAKARLASLASQYQAVVKFSPWAVFRPSECTSVMNISMPASFWPPSTMPNSAACLIELMVSPPALARPTICALDACARSEEHTSELQSLMRISYAVFCLKQKKNYINHQT